MDFYKKKLLPLTLGILTFLKSYGTISGLEQDELYVETGEENDFDDTIQSPWEEFYESVGPVNIGLMIAFSAILTALGPECLYFYAVRYGSEVTEMRKYLKENFPPADGVFEPKYIQRQEGNMWCWISVIQGILKKQYNCDLSQENVYSLTHNNKKPRYFESLRCKETKSQVDSDGLIAKSCDQVLVPLTKKIKENGLYPYDVQISHNENDNSPFTKEDYKKMIKHLINHFGSCFGISDPIRAQKNKGHMVLLSDYDDVSETLTFEDPASVQRYQVSLDKYCELCNSGFGDFSDVKTADGEDRGVILRIIGFTEDCNKGGNWQIGFDLKGANAVHNNVEMLKK